MIYQPFLLFVESPNVSISVLVLGKYSLKTLQMYCFPLYNRYFGKTRVVKTKKEA